MTWKAFLEKRPWEMTLNLRIIDRKFNGSFDVVQPLVLKHHEQGSFPEGIVIGEGWNSEDNVTGFLQALMDLAWDEGIRPVQLENTKNELTAVRYHLEDMRKLAMK